MEKLHPVNVFGMPLEPCCTNPVTGFMRDGFCHAVKTDPGVHVICVEMTAEFLEFSKNQGNDLSTPRPEWNFPGLEPGDRWCLCASRWVEALEAGIAPKVVLESCHESMLDYVSLDKLVPFAVKG